MSDDNSKMHYFQNEKPEPFMGLSNISFVTRYEFEREQFERKELTDKVNELISGINGTKELWQAVNKLIAQVHKLEEHHTRQIDENRKSFNSLEELRVKLMLLGRRYEKTDCPYCEGTGKSEYSK